MQAFIRGLIEKTEAKYKLNYSDMLADYNRENETAKGYNGRQILELLQNCDDEGSKEVLISLDTELKTISISNTGTPFSENGYRSLFISNLSSKTSKKRYIGNKGLGFRSVITWSEGIEIISNNISLYYSEKRRRENFEKLVTSERQRQIRLEENLKKSVCPIPFLTLPKLSIVEQEDFATTIRIHYSDKYLNDIIKQVKEISSETTLFLRHIENIYFEGVEGKPDIQCRRKKINSNNKEFSPRTLINYSDSEWEVFETESPLPLEFSDSDREEEELCQIKIAIEKSLSRKSPFLFSFFPTRIRLEQPYILHATFDLDSNRNQINDSPKNRYILDQIIGFTIQVAKYFTLGEVSYKPLEILLHQHEADTLKELGYYQKIEEALDSEPVFPCIDDTYKKKSETIFLSNSFAEALIEAGGWNDISYHLIPCSNEDFVYQFNVDSDLNCCDNVFDQFDAIFSRTLSIIARAKLIGELVWNAGSLISAHKNQFNFLINSEGELIKGEEFSYTPVTKENNLRIPSFTKIEFINKSLFDELIEVLGYEEDESKNKGRFLYDQLIGFVNIHSYEPATVAGKIVSEANRALEKEPSRKHEIVKEMNSCLFHNFKLFDSETKLKAETSVPSIAKSGEIKKASSLVFSDQYPLAKGTEEIFQGIYQDRHYLADPLELGFGTIDNISEVQRYLQWIGVNKYVCYKRIEGTTSGISEYFFSNLVKYGHDSTYTNYSVTYTTFSAIDEILTKLSPNRLIFWVQMDSELRSLLDDNSNSDEIKYYYYSQKTIWGRKESFIKYKIKKYFSFEEFLIDDKFSWVNEVPISYNNSLFANYGITKKDIISTLYLLGATDDIAELPIHRIIEIINLIPERFPDGTGSQSLYKYLLGYYRENGGSINDEILLFANNGNQVIPYPNDQVYFSEGVKIPRSLYKSFPIFNFPARAGGREAIEFFNLNDLSEVQIEVNDHVLLTEVSEMFSLLLSELKPYILAHRLNDITEEKLQKRSASICKRLEIKLVETLSYTAKDKKLELDKYEYLPEDVHFYIRVDPHDSISNLRSNPDFRESFAHIIAAAFGTPGAKNEFKYMLREPLKDVEISVINEFGKDALNDSRSLLGLANSKQTFWEAIFKAKGIIYTDVLDDVSLESKISRELGAEVSLSSFDYDNLLKDEFEIEKLKDFLLKLNIELADLNAILGNKISLYERHAKFLRKRILSNKQRLKYTIWKRLEKQAITKKELFLSEINKLENCEDFVSVKARLHQFEFIVDSDSIFEEFLELIFGFEELETSIKVDLNDLYYKNRGLFSHSDQQIIDESTGLKSLLYFEDGLEELKKRLGENKKAILNEPKLKMEMESQVSPQMKSDFDLKPIKHWPKKKSNKKSVYTHQSKTDKAKKLRGLKSEEAVFRFLKEHKDEYLNIDPVSLDSDGLHCDFRYTTKEGQIKYVEVKTFDDDTFSISKDEYDFGLAHQNDYELWLVRKNRDIFRIDDFFSNPKYKGCEQPSEYVVRLKLQK